MSKPTKLMRLREIRERKMDLARRAYGEALKTLMQAERLLKMLKIRRVEFSKAIDERAKADTEALVAQAVDINDITAGHNAYERRQRALAGMDKDIEMTRQHRERCADNAESTRIAYADASKAEKKIAELVSRETIEAARMADRLEELSQDVTVRDAKTGRWNTRPST